MPRHTFIFDTVTLTGMYEGGALTILKATYNDEERDGELLDMTDMDEVAQECGFHEECDLVSYCVRQIEERNATTVTNDFFSGQLRELFGNKVGGN